jgi:hypothetical protein
MSARAVRTAAGLLTDGGYLQCLASWAHYAGRDWTERVAGWVAGTGCDAWVVEYGTDDPDTYVQDWATEDDTPPVRRDWVSWLRHEGIETVGWGLITLRNSGHANPSFRAESLPGQQITGTSVTGLFSRQDWLRSQPDLLSARYTAASSIALRTDAALDRARGWQITRRLLTVPGDPPRTGQVSELIAAVIEGCDGSLPLREQLTKLATRCDADPADLISTVAPAIPRLVEHGYIQPASLPPASTG